MGKKRRLLENAGGGEKEVIIPEHLGLEKGKGIRDSVGLGIKTPKEIQNQKGDGNGLKKQGRRRMRGARGYHRRREKMKETQTTTDDWNRAKLREY